MKAIIISILLLFTFLGAYYFIFHRENISNNNFDGAIYTLKEYQNDLEKFNPLLKDVISINNLSDFKEYIKKDSQIISYEFDEFRNVYNGFIFDFDSTGELINVKSDFRYFQATGLDDYNENFAPIISYIFEHAEYKNINWGTDILWSLYLIIIGIILVINFILLIIRKNIKYLSYIIIYLIFTLMINSFHLMLSNKYFIDQLSGSLTSSIPTYASFLKIMGLLTHSNAMIFDANIITISLLSLSIIIFLRNNKKTV